ncbi:MAG: hypothetical protein ACI8X5_003840 [Planctomycetota bacterium]|jgi:hypothetical protein
MSTRIQAIALGTTLLVLASCKATPAPYDYSAFLESRPRSILVLPPLDKTLEAGASTHCLATVTRPLAERGYYVFPVAIIDLMMRENGLPTPFEMHQVPISKLREVFDPDAVLYLTVTDWGSSYQVLSSVTTVSMQGVLVDAGTGETIWVGEHSSESSSSGGSSGLIESLVGALVDQVANSLSDPSTDLSRQNAWALFSNDRHGLLPGPYHPEHDLRFNPPIATPASTSHATK